MYIIITVFILVGILLTLCLQKVYKAEETNIDAGVIETLEDAGSSCEGCASSFKDAGTDAGVDASLTYQDSVYETVVKAIELKN